VDNCSAAELLASPPERVRKIGPSLKEELESRRLDAVRAVLLHKPSRYEDRSQLTKLSELKAGSKAAFIAEVRRPRLGRPRRGGRTLLCQLVDGSAAAEPSLTAVWFHVRPWFHKELKTGARFFFAGDVREGKTGGLVVFNPEYEDVGEESLETESAKAATHFGRRVPLYPGTRHARAFRTLVRDLLERVTPDLGDPLPEALRQTHGLLSLREALSQLHFPDAAATEEQLERRDTEAHRRLAFDEFLLLSLELARRRQGFRSIAGTALRAEAPAVRRAIDELPFRLTAAQTRAVHEIAGDLLVPHPMQRLLEGDVGSGKTAVAAVALRIAVESGMQAALMAPTELLAEQHHRSLRALLAPARIPVHLITQDSGGAKGPGAQAIASGEPGVAVGTQALIQEGLAFQSLALAVVDEQHRFGVQDRLKLIRKGRSPHVLLMSATPIPRTLALAVHGDLDLSILDELPPGRMPIATELLTGKSQARAVEALREEVARGRQAYVVYPLVEESEKIDLLDATRGAERVQAALPEARIALVHGQMPAAEREAQMERFRRGAVDVLVATTVVEVGVDVSNATLMVVANAERFGLAQLHQLRGRVGRGVHPSRCLLLGKSPLSMSARKRLKAMERLTDGFRLAELDLELRGSGELLGTRQSGLPELSFADPARHLKLLTAARSEAFALIARDPELSAPASRELVAGLQGLFGERRSLGSVG
jgi:ATP-dependent DNA helicase RecG